MAGESAGAGPTPSRLLPAGHPLNSAAAIRYNKAMKTGRNAPCPCDSGKKFKHCCAGKEEAASNRWFTLAMIAVVILLVVGMVGFIMQGAQISDDPNAGKVWSEEHGHWH